MEVNIIGAIILIIINIIIKKHTDKEYKKLIKPRMEYSYWRNVEFKNITPVEAGILSGKEKIGSNTFISILFELERQDIINIELVDKKYYISLKCRDLKKINELKEYESKIIKIVFKGTEDDSKIELLKVIKLISEDLGYKTYLDNIFKEIKNNILTKYYHSYTDIGINSLLKVIPLFMILINCYSLISTSFLFSDTMKQLLNSELHNYAICINAVGGLLVIIQIVLFIKLIKTFYVKDEYLDEVYKLKGLYKYIIDFSTINEKEITHYELYERYYTYAVSMGIADKFEEELKSEQDKMPTNIESNLSFLLAYKNILKNIQGKKLNLKKEKIVHFRGREKFAILCFIISLLSASIIGIEMMSYDFIGGILMQFPIIFVISIVTFCIIYTRKQKIISKIHNKVKRWK